MQQDVPVTEMFRSFFSRVTYNTTDQSKKRSRAQCLTTYKGTKKHTEHGSISESCQTDSMIFLKGTHWSGFVLIKRAKSDSKNGLEVNGRVVNFRTVQLYHQPRMATVKMYVGRVFRVLHTRLFPKITTCDMQYCTLSITFRAAYSSAYKDVHPLMFSVFVSANEKQKRAALSHRTEKKWYAGFFKAVKWLLWTC